MKLLILLFLIGNSVFASDHKYKVNQCVTLSDTPKKCRLEFSGCMLPTTNDAKILAVSKERNRYYVQSTICHQITVDKVDRCIISITDEKDQYGDRESFPVTCSDVGL